jgi:4'-phosphopantetheinyl transferase EntD
MTPAVGVTDSKPLCAVQPLSGADGALDIRMLQDLLPPECVLIGETVSVDRRPDLYPEEFSCIALAVEKRQREFASGRFCARRASQALGLNPAAIPVGSRRQPVWPAGITGSITHDGHYALAAVARAAKVPFLGIDLALQDPLDASLIELVCGSKESEEIRRITFQGCDPFKLVFSLKEAVFKCLFPAVGRIFDFHDVWVSLHPERPRAEIHLENAALFSRAPRLVEARYCVSAGYIFSAVWCSQ